ncbi:acyl-CoA thioesterase [Sansalvadorimonas sp. 2012CJ34-2]|uniref:Acyl-CoA thioesterase n=1 Tax=Parendozoicomonas callyspongiae TaxID=2942213 RepID=A0ABT0PDQ2_9GAMM|nr:acyl-CoA thioesterase [Sansalvadorimonas sp. 2012CJ34-2]MCL6269391.1 acyl-CoA thioesterase [Sansalvadorimonas sp. 2012CJ34-2]
MTTQAAMSQNLSWDLPNPFILKISCAGEHEDRLGHINNVEYLNWLEDVSWQHITQLGAPWYTWKQHDVAMATVETRVKYLAAAHAGDLIKVATWITEHDKLRARRQFQIIRISDGKTLLRAEKDYVCIALSSGKPKKMPGFMSDAYEAGVAAAKP